MFIAHIPAGYLAASWLHKRGAVAGGLFAACIIGSVFPDIDLLYFYLIDGKSHHHHSYWIHYPVLWLALSTLSAAWYLISGRRTAALLALAFCANAFLHIMLDGIVGDIWLFAPWINRHYALATVSPGFSPWWLNFILHWSFLFELLITGLAASIWTRRNKLRRTIVPHSKGRP